MPESRNKYLFERLGDHDFQQLVAALLANQFSDFTPMPLRQSDGGRDGLRKAPDGSTLVYQVKWSVHGSEKDPVAWLDANVRQEEENLQRLATEGVRRYILVTNVPSTGRPQSGTFDRLNERLAEHAKRLGFEEMACAWREAVNAWVDNAPVEIKWTYADMLAGWDLIRYLVAEHVGTAKDSRIRAMVRKVAAVQWEEDERVKFTQVDVDRERVVDLFVDVHAERVLTVAGATSSLPLGPVGGAASYLLHTAAPFTLVRGAPGQGKSTLSQYVSQAHRAAFVAEDARPARLRELSKPRFPLRCDLSDYARWLSGIDPWDDSDEPKKRGKPPKGAHASVESFLASFISYATGGLTTDVEVVHDLFGRVPSMVVLDGLDEVGSPTLRAKVVRGIDQFVVRGRAYPDPPRVVVTTRPSAGALPEPSLNTFEVITLEALSSDQRAEYLRRWCTVRGIRGRDGRSLRKNFTERSKEVFIEELAGNPMQLTILLDLLHKQGMATPTQRTDLYNEYVDLLLAREANKHPDVVRRHREELLEIVPFLGWYLQAHSEQSPVNARMTLADLRAAMAHFQRAYGNSESAVDDLFRATSDRLWALTSKTEGTYEFEVVSLREYFAARFLFRNAGEGQPSFDRAVVLQELLRRPYWLNTARFYAGNAKGSDVYTVAAAIEDETRHSEHAPTYLAAWSLLTDGVFARRPREARRVLAALCSDRGLPILISALERRDITQLPQLPQLSTGEGPDPTWERLTAAIKRDPADGANVDRISALRDLLNARAEFGEWWRSQTLAAIGTSEQSAWMSIAARCEGGAGLVVDFPPEAMNYGDAERLLNTGILPEPGSAMEAALMEAVKDGECSAVTSIRALPAQLAVAFSPRAFLCSASGAFSESGDSSGRRRSDAIQHLKRVDVRLAEAAQERRFKTGHKGSTFPWANTASALFDQMGRRWLVTEIAALGAASPFSLGYVKKPQCDAFGANGHPVEMLAQSREHSNDALWWRAQLAALTDEADVAEWALALWGVAQGSIIDELFDAWTSAVHDLPTSRRRETLLRACATLCDSGWLAKRPVESLSGDPKVQALLERRRGPRGIDSGEHSHRTGSSEHPALAPLIQVARTNEWLKVDGEASYR